MKHWLTVFLCELLAALVPQAWGYAPESHLGGMVLAEPSFDPVWNLADANGYSFCGGDPLNRFDADGRIGKSALNWATGIDLDSNVPLAEQIQAHRQGGAEYLWTAVPAFVDAVAGSLIGCLFTPQDLWVMEQRTMGANTPEVQAYNQLAQIVHEHVGSPLAGLGVYDSGSANAQWGRELGEMALFVGVLESAKGQISRRSAPYYRSAQYRQGLFEADAVVGDITTPGDVPPGFIRVELPAGSFVNRVYDSSCVPGKSQLYGQSFCPGAGLPTDAAYAITTRGLNPALNNAQLGAVFRVNQNITVYQGTALGGTAPELFIPYGLHKYLTPVLRDVPIVPGQ